MFISTTNSKQRGFTIVELLIVVVVIAILAAITIVAYNGISTRAVESGLKSDLSNGAKQIQLFKTTSGSYPGSTAEVNDGKGMKNSQNTALTYAGQPQTYCLSASSTRNANLSFYITEAGKIQSGQCSAVTACFQFNAATFTLAAWYNNENDNPANPECSPNYSIPSQINGVQVRVLGTNLFYGRPGPGTVVIPSSVTTIGNSAFSESELQSITIPSSVTSIGSTAFSFNSLGAVTIPNSVTSIGTDAFRDGGVSALTLSNPSTTYGNGAFSYNGISSISLPSGMTTIVNSMFLANDIRSVSIPSTVTTIREYAFSENYNLSSVTIPASVNLIENGAFEYTNLTSVSVKTGAVIQPYAFDEGVTINRY